MSIASNRNLSAHAISVLSLAVALVVAIAAPATAQEKRTPESLTELQLSYAPLVKRAAPAVVNVYTSKVVTARQRSPFFDDPFFRRFFGDGFSGAPRQRTENSLGSGVIVGADGTIVTNHHVIEGAYEIRVVLSDRREFDARLLVDDERSDMAVLKVESDTPLPPTPLCASRAASIAAHNRSASSPVTPTSSPRWPGFEMT